jgi:endonuclease/exonuclease/phosphatase family metal-dependent hydrolase
MKFPDFPAKFNLRAPVVTGAVFCACIGFLLVSCGKKDGTPDWDTPGADPGALAPAVVAPAGESPSPEAPNAEPQANEPAGAAAAVESSKEGLRFIAYNVENWLTMDRYVDDKPLKGAPKPDSEKEAVVKLMVRHAPDVIGLCEIGTAEDLAEIRESLKAAGLDLPHSHYTGGSDSVRHLGLLSRFPITSTGKPAETEFKLAGQTYAINRGILDASVKARGKDYRFLGVHLKSKREADDYDQEEMRIHEAHLLRRHVDSILAADGDARLVVYGDFNDTRPTKAFKAVTGNYNDPGYLTAIPAKDSRGHAWTHHWSFHDIYSRIDFVTVSRGLRPDVDFRASYIVDDPEWDAASDHRPLVVILR